ncbi:endonuclease III domain-containing protein [Parasphingorhabdus cellanae]|uniref:Endonuclease III n=1 Tax=Parasphingorhabdus cellanae TaxID=2806553 RepID=A0ABX7T4E1_9SPHN|nr:endonuclease III [Parasphingorhabdus cellanae]QTD55685.1 endonuclease III [Parasphingorhabdus cellanae]
MQVTFDFDSRPALLDRIQQQLIARFGRIVRPAEKRRDPVWTVVQGVIGARSKTAVSNASTDQLLADFGTWEAVAGLPLEILTDYLAHQTFPDLSASRLKDCLSEIINRCGAVDLSLLAEMKTADAMTWLESLPSVARKISAGVVSNSTLERKALVIDTHHRRVVQRIGLVPPKADTTRAYDILMPVLPPDWSAADIDEHHLLIKRLGQTHCRPSRPNCADCPVRGDCETGQVSGKQAS